MILEVSNQIKTAAAVWDPLIQVLIRVQDCTVKTTDEVPQNQYPSKVRTCPAEEMNRMRFLSLEAEFVLDYNL